MPLVSIPQTRQLEQFWSFPLPPVSHQLCPEGAWGKTQWYPPHPSYPNPSFSRNLLTWLGGSTWEGPDSQPIPVPKLWRDTWGDRAGEGKGEGQRDEERQVRRGSPDFWGFTTPPMPERGMWVN